MPRQHAPATLRNREPILDVLRRVLPDRGTVLEVASGTGEHAAFFASHLPGVTWQPTDRDPAALQSVASWVEHVAVDNLRPPLKLDATSDDWPLPSADAVVCINMVHISPWEATLGLLRGAARVLPEGGPLVLYGPYRIGGAHTAPSNEAFDQSLRARDPRWGVRDLDDVIDAALKAGLTFVERVPMPANNQVLVFRAGAGG